MKSRLFALVLPLLALAFAKPAAAQVIFGKVLDAATGAPVPEVTVSALKPNGRAEARARTDAQGAFTLQLPAGSFRLEARRVGYQTTTAPAVELVLRETVQLDLRISTSQVVLDPLTVTTRSTPPRSPRLEAQGFYTREQQGFGRFLTQHDVQMSNPIQTSEVFRTVPGLTLLPAGGSRYRIALRRGGDNCMPVLIVDNLPVPTDDLDNFVKPWQVDGIEVYRGNSEIPGRWRNHNSACGLIVVWTQQPSVH